MWGRPAEASAQQQAYAHYIAALVHERAGRPAEAQREMERVAELDPEAVTPTLRLVRAYLRQQRYDKALAMCERAVHQVPEQANLWVLLGEIYQQQKRYDDALTAFQKAIEISPENVLGYGALAELQESTNDLVAAVEVYGKLIKLNPQSAGLYFQLGVTLARMNDRTAARDALRRALELNPNLIRAHFLLGTLAIEQGDAAESVAHLQHYVRRRPGDTQAAENLAGALARLGRYGDASALFAALLAGAQVEPQHHLEAMYVMLKMEKPGEAEKLVPPEGAPIIGTLLRAVARQMKNEPYLPLLESLDTIESDLDEECSNSVNELLYLFGAESAGPWIVEHIAQFRTEVSSRTLGIIQARTLMRMERYADAVAVLEDVLKSFPPEKWVHYYLAICYEELDRFDETEAHLRASLNFDPDDPDLLNFLGYLYAEYNTNLDEAEKLINKALSITPDSPFYLDSLGWVYYRKGEADKALELIQRAIYGMDTDDAVLRDHLGDVWLLKGDPERAVEQWERARRLDPGLKGVQEKIRGQTTN